MNVAHAQRVRCAIYTRKSSEEGLEQGFNSLDAQREACAAYILSQASEGWVALPDLYDDGGISGGTLERPALKRLMADVEAGRIDVIVVYKVDRLSRSLFDFAKLVEAFEKAGTSFVSITQSFNTTSSMGRLTLNMLLSFAQFEREVTAERIRDKIAASKAKGMWMGGVPPLGYAPDGRSLRIVADHADLVRMVFERYLQLGSVRLLLEWLEEQRIRLPRRTLANGKMIGGGGFLRGQLYFLLRNRIYLGEIPHRDTSFPGQHKPIIDRVLFDAVQAKLADNVQGQRSRRSESEALLAGRIVDQDGQSLVSSHAAKGKVRYRYYVSRDRQRGLSKGGIRVPAPTVERAVTEGIVEVLHDPIALLSLACLDVDDLQQFAEQCRHVAAIPRAQRARRLLTIVEQVQVTPDGLRISVERGNLASLLGARPAGERDEPIMLSVEGRFRRSRGVRLVTSEGRTIEPSPEQALPRLMAKAHGWWAELRKGQLSVTDLAQRDDVTSSYVTRVLRLAFLSPAVTQAALGQQLRDEVDATSLTLRLTIPGDWREQGKVMLPR